MNLKLRISALLLGICLLAGTLTGCSGNPAGNASYHQGYWRGDTFLAQQAGFTFSLPQGMSAQQEQQTSETAQKLLGLSSPNAAVCDLYAAGDTGAQALLLAENLTLSFPNSIPDANTYAQALKERLSGQSNLAAGEISLVKFIGQEFSKLPFTNARENTQTWYLMRRSGNTMLVVVLTGKDEAAIEEIASSFSVYSDEAAQLNAVNSQDQKELKTTFHQGAWKEDRYTNESMGITFPMPEGFSAMDKQKLRTFSGGTTVAVGDELTVADGYEDISLYDMGIFSSGGTSLVLLAQDLSSNTATQQISTRAYADVLLTKLENAPGYGFASGGIQEVTLAGAPYVRLCVTAQDGSVTQWYYLRRMGDHMVCMVLTAPSADVSDLEGIVSSIQAVQE